jgi:hypothetical protein
VTCKQATVQQPLLGNSCVDTFPRQRQEHATVEETFSVRSVPSVYNVDQLPLRDSLEMTEE